jgi:hypothetical protein
MVFIGLVQNDRHALFGIVNVFHGAIAFGGEDGEGSKYFSAGGMSPIAVQTRKTKQITFVFAAHDDVRYFKLVLVLPFIKPRSRNETTVVVIVSELGNESMVSIRAFNVFFRKAWSGVQWGNKPQCPVVMTLAVSLVMIKFSGWAKPLNLSLGTNRSGCCTSRWNRFLITPIFSGKPK